MPGGVAPRACLAICLHVSSSHHNRSCLLRWSLSLCITTLHGSLLWSPYFWFVCSAELCGSLLWSSILPIQHPALPTPHRKWFMVGIQSGKFLHWSFFNATVLVGGNLHGWFPQTGLPWNLFAVPGIWQDPHQPLMALVSKLNWQWVWYSFIQTCCSICLCKSLRSNFPLSNLTPKKIISMIFAV